MKAISFLKQTGKAKTLADVNNPKGQFINGDVYVVVLDLNGVMLAHPINPKIVGCDKISLTHKPPFRILNARKSNFLSIQFNQSGRGFVTIYMPRVA